MASEPVRDRTSYVCCPPEAITKSKHILVPSRGLAANMLKELNKKAREHNSYMYVRRERTQEAWTGWNRGEPQKPPAVWAPPPGNAQPEGKRGTREKTRCGAGENCTPCLLLAVQLNKEASRSQGRRYKLRLLARTWNRTTSSACKPLRNLLAFYTQGCDTCGTIQTC